MKPQSNIDVNKSIDEAVTTSEMYRSATIAVNNFQTSTTQTTTSSKTSSNWQ